MSLVARDVIKIHAVPEDVWAVLAEPEYIIQWDEFPDGHVVGRGFEYLFRFRHKQGPP